MGRRILPSVDLLKSPSSHANEIWWRKQIRRHQRRWNFAWWLDWLCRGCIPATTIWVVLLLLARGLGWPLRLLIDLSLLAFLLGSGIAWLMAKPYFLTTQATLAQLDDQFAMDGRLLSAYHEIIAWPDPIDRSAHRPIWRLGRFSLHATLSLALLASAFLIPLGTSQSPQKTMPTEPSSWQQTQQWIDQLKQDHFTQSEAIQEFQIALNQLKDVEPENWYRHENLEASDALRDTLKSGIKNQQQGIQALQQAIQSIQNASNSTSSTNQKTLEHAWKAIQHGSLPLDVSKFPMLSEKGGQGIPHLTPEQWKAIAAQLQHGLSAASPNAMNPTETENQIGNSHLIDSSQALQSDRQRNSTGGSTVDSPSASAPLSLSNSETQLKTTKIETVPSHQKSSDFSHIGEKVGTQSRSPQISETIRQSITPGGTITTHAESGVTWEVDATPEEQNAIQRFFNGAKTKE